MINITLLRLAVLLLSLAIQGSLCAAIANYGSWDSLEIYLNQKKPVFFYLKTESRLYFNSNRYNEYYLRPAIGYNATKKLSLWLGYEFRQSITYPEKQQNMIWEQAEYKAIDVEKIKIVFRTRFQQAFTPIASGVGYILRERITVKLNHLISAKISPIFYEETFFLLNHPRWDSSHTLCTNEAFLGIQTPVSKEATIRVGYLNQMLFFPEKAISLNAIYILFTVHLG